MADRRVFRLRFETSGPAQTRALGERVGRVAESGDLFLLEGEFGTGKTVFVQGLAIGLGVPTPVTSPSFVIINQHAGRQPLYHVDLYRLDQVDAEIEDAVADALDAGGVVAVEWPALLPPDLQGAATWLRFQRMGECSRIIEVETCQQRLARALEDGGSAARD